VELKGQPRIDALDAFSRDFPDNPYQTNIASMRADTAAEVQAESWRLAWDALNKTMGRLATEEIDQRRNALTEYLKTAEPQAGNPYTAMARKNLEAIETEGVARLTAALDSADRDLIYNNFEPAMDKLAQYKQRFKDSVNNPKADDKSREIATKAFNFWQATQKAALAKLLKDVQSKSARQEVDNVIVKLKGIGTLAADAKQFSEDLKVFDELHKRAATSDVIPNVQNRIMPEVLHVQGKTGLSIREIDPLRVKMTEGGTPVTYMKNWTDLTLADRLVVYAYLLQPDGEEMPADIQTLLDKAQQVMQP
jgi:hypothetical protein